MTTKAFIVATEALTAALQHQPAAVIVAVMLDDGTGFIQHAHSPPENKEDLDQLVDQLNEARRAGWPGEPLRVER